jgi:hypothetical protein
MDSFIRGYNNVLEKDVLDRLIAEFEKIQENSGYNGDTQFKGRAGRHDRSINIEDHSPDLSGAINKALNPYLNEYLAEFPGGENVNVIGYNIKIQRTDPTGGYHVWHCEHSGRVGTANRALVWILYLNDIEEGGETEFLNQKQRITPAAGRLVIFPAAFPWQHRGNPPLAGTKYIATGWWHYHLT